MTAEALAPLAIAVPALAAVLLLGTGRWLPRLAIDLFAIAAALAVLTLDLVLLAAERGGRVVTWSGGWTPPAHGFAVGIVLVADPIGTGLAAVSAALVTAALVFSRRYYRSQSGHYHALLLLFLLGLTGFALTGDLFDMLVFFELMGAVAYALTAFLIEDSSAVQGGLNFGIVNSLGAYLTLSGVALLYGRTGRLGLPQLAQALTGTRPDVLVVVAFVLVCTGWLVKAAAFPFHFWTADAEAVAPAPVCAVLSGAMVEAGLYGVARVYWSAFHAVLPPGDVRPALVALGVATALTGAVMCPLQRDLKRLLAYSTIAHVGLMLVAVGALGAAALAAGAAYLLGQSGVKGALFLVAGIVRNRFGSVDEAELHGRGRRADPVAWVMVAGALGLAALPPFGTALGASLAEEAIGPAVLPLFVLVGAATGGAVLRAAGRIFFGAGPAVPGVQRAIDSAPPEPGSETGSLLRATPAPMLGAAMALVAGGLAAGFVPGGWLAGAAARFTDTRGEAAQALTGAAAAALHAGTPTWTASGVLAGLLTAGLAAAGAGAGLWGRRWRGLQRMRRAVQPPLDALRRLHSGHVGDYVAWLVAGVAALLVLVGAPTLL